MELNFPDPETFGESGPKPHEKIDSDDYHSLFDYEEEQSCKSSKKTKQTG